MNQEVTKGKGNLALEQERAFGLWRPCSCGCDKHDGAKGVGYLHGIKNGVGVCVWIEKEETFQALKQFVPLRG